MVELLPEDEAARLLRKARDEGIRRFDTAPSYGVAEERLGRFLGPGTEVWTKLGPFGRGAIRIGRCQRSLEASLERLRRERLDLVQWHNWTADLLDDAEFLLCCEKLRKDQRVGDLGATTYGSEDACAAVTSGFFRVVQLEWNLLNQSVLDSVHQLVSRGDVAIALRSVFLQGVLTGRGEHLPRSLDGLREPRLALVKFAGDWGMDVAELALRAALNQPGVASVVFGVDEEEALSSALAAARSGPLPSRCLAELKAFDLKGAPVADPRSWDSIVS